MDSPVALYITIVQGIYNFVNKQSSKKDDTFITKSTHANRYPFFFNVDYLNSLYAIYPG